MTAAALSPSADLLCLRVFGSNCRGDQDAFSDIDVLAVHADRPDEGTRASLKESLRQIFGREVDLAEYSAARLQEFFASGHLFAWHLRSESRNLLDGQDKFFESLGEPAPYQNAQSDAGRFLQLLGTIPGELAKSGCSLVFEAGLLYVVSRNIGLCASWELDRRPDFSRTAIQMLSKRLGIPGALSPEEYARLIECRFATIRGLDCEPPSLDWMQYSTRSLLNCCTRVYKEVFENSYE